MRHIRFWANFALASVPPILLSIGAVSTLQHSWNYLSGNARLAALVSREATQALGRPVVIRDIRFRRSPWSLMPNRVELIDISISQNSPGE